MPEHRSLATTAIRLALPLLAPGALAQSISTTPLAAAPVVAVPVDNPLVLATLVIAMLTSGILLRRGRPWRSAAIPLLAVTLGGALWQSPELRAQLVSTFTNPAGETLPIPVQQIASNGDVAGFEVADFSNASGVPLTVSGLELPTEAQCFPGGLSGNLLPPDPPADQAPPACTSGSVLAPNASCRVDVDSLCRDLAPVNPVSLTQITPTSGTASGGVGVTLTGTDLSGATSLTFGGIPATSLNVINATTVTAVAPAGTPGTVDVVISTPAGAATLSQGFTYLATAVGQSSGGGIIGALDGGLNNLIVAFADNSAGIQWGGLGTAIGAGAQSLSDGAANTAAIVATLGDNSGTPYAAQLCSAYEVDSQGNTPCEVGNSCYNDWFLPALEQRAALFINRLAIGGFSADFHWSSTEFSSTSAWTVFFLSGSNLVFSKANLYRIRCTRAFLPGD